jgi:hypothetical protein
MTLQGAVIREQGVTFAVVIVKMHVIDSSTEAGQSHRHLPAGFSQPAGRPDGAGRTRHADLLRSQGHRPVPGWRAAPDDPVAAIHGLMGIFG